MDIQQCREVIAVADTLSFSEAAGRAYVSQSALSKHVAAAEREAGFRIFDRDTSRVALTSQGAMFVDGLRKVVAAYDEALRAARDVCAAGMPPSLVRVVGPMLNDELSHLIGLARERLLAQNDRALVTVRDVGLRDSVAALLANEADVALAFSYGNAALRDRRLYAKRLLDIPFGIACYRNNPLAEKTSLTFDDLRGVPLLTYPVDGRAAYHDYVARVCRTHGIDAPRAHCEEGVICIPMTSEQVVFGVYFPGFARVGIDIVSRPLDDRRDVFELYLVRRRREDAVAVRAFFDAVLDAARREA